MSTALPTVRVADPMRPGQFVRINRADLQLHHALWPEQDVGHDHDAVVRLLTPSLDPSVRDLAASLMISLASQRLALFGEAWADLRPDQQLAALREAETDIEALVAIRQSKAMPEPAGDPAEPSAVMPPALLADPARLSTPAAVPFHVAKANGPRGLWYVMQGEARASKGFTSKIEADAEHTRMGQAG